MNNILDQIKYDANGLVTAIIQDASTNEVIMCAFMNKESLTKTLAEGKCCYWSRSRQKLWLKGESSGHFQFIKEIRVDCDGDALLFKVEQTGGACHTGHYSCFYRKEENGQWVIDGKKVFDEEDVYKKS